VDRYLKQLGDGWTKAEDGSYRRTYRDRSARKVVRTPDGKGWVPVVLYDNAPSYGHHYPSFRTLLESLNS
jgi:hypothetical protein